MVYYKKKHIKVVNSQGCVWGSEKRPIGKMKEFLEDIQARNFVPNLVLDIGANHGDWTRITHRIFPEASFILIEPQEEMKKSLDNLCSEFQNISWVKAAAGAKQDKLMLTVWADLAGSSLLPDINDINKINKANKELLHSVNQREVDVITIDQLLESHDLNYPDIIKLDVQGFELEALKGASSCFGNTELFILEVSLFPFMGGKCPILREVIEFMGNRGYELYDIPGYLRRPLDGALGQVDIAFAKQDGILRHLTTW